MTNRFSITLVLVGLTACLGESELRQRSAFDLSCPAEQLQLTPLSGGVTGVTGCGKKATYMMVQVGRDSWNWQMNGPPTSEATAPASQDPGAKATPSSVAPSTR